MVAMGVHSLITATVDPVALVQVGGIPIGVGGVVVVIGNLILLPGSD